MVRNLEVIGEAVKYIPRDARGRYPHIPWQRIAGLRDILIHEYFGIDLDIVWDVVTSKLADLKTHVASMVDDDDEQAAG